MHTILFISPLPPPEGGIATWTKKIFQYGLSNDSRLVLVNTKIRGDRNIFDKTYFSMTELVRTFNIFILLLYQLLINRPKLIHLNCSLSSVGIFRDLICVILAKMLGIPVITQYHGNLPDFKRRFYGLNRYCLKWLMRLTNVNIVTNQPSFNEAVAINKKMQLILLPNFIEDNIFNYSLNDKCANQKLRAIFAGGITQAKGCLEILEIAHYFPDVEFHLFGKMHADVEPLFKNRPSNLCLHGVINQETVLQEMQASDFLLFPSYTEGFPLTVLEAMAVGLPIIASCVGAIPEMIDEGRGGYLVQPTEIIGLIAAIDKIKLNHELRIAMGKYNKEKSYNHYRYTIVVHQLVAIYNQFL